MKMYIGENGTIGVLVPDNVDWVLNVEQENVFAIVRSAIHR